MKQPLKTTEMEIKIQVEIGITPAVAAIAEKFLRPGARTTETAPQRGTTETAPQRGTTETAPQRGTAPDKKPEPQPETPEAPQQEPEAPEPEPEASNPEPTAAPDGLEPGPDGIIPPTDKEMRDLMDITISRLAGNGWKESNDPKTLAVRKGCTKAFKQIAAHLGAEKPTGLRDGKRTEFCKELDNIFIDTKDNSVTWKPF